MPRTIAAVPSNSAAVRFPVPKAPQMNTCRDPKAKRLKPITIDRNMHYIICNHAPRHLQEGTRGPTMHMRKQFADRHDMCTRQLGEKQLWACHDILSNGYPWSHWAGMHLLYMRDRVHIVFERTIRGMSSYRFYFGRRLPLQRLF